MLKTLMLRKRLDDAKKALEALRSKDEELQKREEELTGAIEEAQTEEEKSAVEEEIEKYEADKKAHEEEKADLEQSVEDLEGELAEAEAEDAAKVSAAEEAEAARAAAAEKEKREAIKMSVRAKRLFGKMERREVNDMMQREDVKNYLDSVRECIKNKRAVTNAGLTIPSVMLDLLRENIMDYSKLYRHVNVQSVSGDARQPIMGTVPEAVWTECCANLNDLDIGFADVEVDCYKVGGYFKVCNATLEDSDIDLAAALLEALGQAIGIALDKAILYGQNTASTLKMPE